MRVALTLLFAAAAVVANAQTSLYAPNSGAIGTTLTNNGKVGIGSGNNNPDEGLHVFGNIKLGDFSDLTTTAVFLKTTDGRAGLPGNTGRHMVVMAGSSDNNASAIAGSLYLRAGKPTSPSNNWGKVIIADEGGNVGVGTLSPAWKMDVNGQIAARGQAIVDSNATDIFLGDIAGGDGMRSKLFLCTNDTKQIVIDGSGNMGIGLGLDGSGVYILPDAKLAVKGQIHATEVRVTTNVPGPDYVFAKGYNLPSLETVKSYIEKNHHLPEVPSAKEIESNGIKVGEMNMILLKKIEELTLYVIELKKENEIQSKEIADLKSK
jgi:hypothetical protein